MKTIPDGGLRKPERPKARFEILNDALRLRAECRQIIIDTHHWNDCVRKPGEEPIEPDPEGKLSDIIGAIEAGLAKELLCVHVSGPDEIEARRDLHDADQRAAELNRLFDSFEQTENTPTMHATVQAWPYDAASHAESLRKGGLEA